MYREYKKQTTSEIMSETRIDTQTPGMDHLMHIMDGYRASQTLAAACDLELFDLISETPGGKASATQIAKDKGWDAFNLERVFNALVALKLLEKDQTDAGHYSVSETGRPLIRKHRYSLWNYATMSGFLDCKKSIKAGVTKEKPKEESGSHGEHGGDPDQDEYQYDSDDQMNEFYVMFDGMMQPHLDALLKNFDLSKYKTVCDLGGGSGFLASEMCRRYGMEAWVFEMPSVVTVAEKNKPDWEKKGYKINLVGGDFEKDELPKTDLYLAVRVVYHWTEDKMGKMLKKVHDSINDGGAILFMEELLENNKDGPPRSHMWEMAVFLSETARVRSGREYNQLLNQHGFKNVSVFRAQKECVYDCVFAEKA